MRPEEYEGEQVDPRVDTPTARELLSQAETWKCHQPQHPPDCPICVAHALAARVEAVLALLPAWRDGYCGDLAKVVQRMLDGTESAPAECLCAVGWRHCPIHQDDGREPDPSAPTLCSICRSVHGPEITHPCE